MYLINLYYYVSIQFNQKVKYSDVNFHEHFVKVYNLLTS